MDAENSCGDKRPGCMLTLKAGLCAYEVEGCFLVNWASQICTGLKVQGLESS